MHSQRKAFAPSALILTALVGSLVVSGGEAKANACPSLNIPPPPGPCLLGFFDPNIQVTFLDQFTPINVAALPAGANVTVGLTGNFYPQSQKQIVTTFAPALVGGGVSTIIEVEKLLPGTVFDGIDLHVNSVGPTIVIKEYGTGYDPVTGNITGMLGTLQVNGANSVFAAIGGSPKKLYIKDTMIPGTGSINSVTNTFRQVPGPLPVLGAGLAFGSIRKLRKFSSELKVPTAV